MVIHPFDSLMELPEQDVRLDCAALHLARDAFPHLNVERYLRQLDELAAQVADLRPGIEAPTRYRAMLEVLTQRFGLRGNADDYYDPDNSYLNRVLDRRCGIPISLAIVWIEVARRLKWPVTGAAFPGHFLVRFDDPERFLLVDPFHEARTLSIADCEQILKQQFEQKVRFSPEMLEPVGTRTILVRVLHNLRSIYATMHAWDRLDSVLQRLAALEPDSGVHRQELAALRFRRGDLRGAYAMLAHVVETCHDGEEVAAARLRLHQIEAAIAALN